jgi:ABC-type Fe3+ transport system permease subunit
VLILCLVALIYVTIKMSMVAPVIAIEKSYNPIRVIGRSWRLTKGNSLRLFLFFLLIAIVYLVVSMLVGVVTGLLMFMLGEEAFKVANAIANGLLSTVIAVVFVAVLAAAHKQLAGDAPRPVSHTFE